MDINPLSTYFRQPALYLELPSKGNFYPKNAIEKTSDNKYPVLPMTTADEVTMNLPAALADGSAVVSIIQSCIPAIKNAWKMPSIDLDAALVAIRLATYGNQFISNSECPNCNSANKVPVDLNNVLHGLHAPDYQNPIVLKDMKIFLKPMDYDAINNNSRAQYDEQEVTKIVANSEIDEQIKIEAVSKFLEKINTAATAALTSNISHVVTPTAEVRNYAHINEWLTNCDRDTFNFVKEKILETKASSEIKPVNTTCKSCSTEYSYPFSFDTLTSE